MRKQSPIAYSAYSGAGNRFIFLDLRDEQVADLKQHISHLCHLIEPRADGVIVAEYSSKADALMRIFNCDGSEASMCGNGLRCFAQFLKEKGMHKDLYHIETRAKQMGILTARCIGEEVEVTMGHAHSFVENISLVIAGKSYLMHAVDTGVPHAVVWVEDVEAIDVHNVGRAIRYHHYFAAAGTNATFVQRLSDNRLKVRIYERGVEAETEACGTGAVAAAVVAHLCYNGSFCIHVEFISKACLKVTLERDIQGKLLLKAEGGAQKLTSGFFLPHEQREVLTKSGVDKTGIE